MPKVQVTTKNSRSVWKSPDGQREIFEVEFDFQGKSLKAKTYSKSIPVAGWSGEVEVEERQGRNGLETFVKQPPKEGYGGTQYGGTPTGTPASRSYQPKDEAAIKAMWSIGQSITAHTISPDLDVNDFGTIESYAKELFAMVDRVKVGPEAPAAPVQDVVITDIGDEPITMAELDNIFGPTEEVPWPKS